MYGRTNLIRRPLIMLVCLGLVLFLAAAAMAKDPYAKADESWISIGGVVNSVTPDSFLLDYGEGRVKVKVEDGDQDADAYQLVPGDRVTVAGRIDKGLFEKTTIVASSVYVEKLGTFYQSKGKDGQKKFDYIPDQVIDAATVVQGVVSEIDDEEFRLDLGGLQTLTVNVSKMSYNPLDSVGIPKIVEGDIVRVKGTLHQRFFSGRELIADSVIRIVAQ